MADTKWIMLYDVCMILMSNHLLSGHGTILAIADNSNCLVLNQDK